MLKNKKQRYVLKITLFIFSNSIIFALGDIFRFVAQNTTYIFTQNKILVWTKLFVGQNISSDLFFVGQNISSDLFFVGLNFSLVIIFITSKKFRHFCPTCFCPIRQLQPVTATYEPNKNTKKKPFKGFKSLKCKLFKQNKRNYDYSILTVHVNNVTFQGIKQQKIADELELSLIHI